MNGCKDRECERLESQGYACDMHICTFCFVSFFLHLHLQPPPLQDNDDLPILRIMRLLKRIAHAGMTGGKDTVSSPLQFRRIEFQIHQFVHVLERDHVAIQLDDAIIFDERERSQFTPAIVEAHVIGVVLGDGGEQIRHMAFEDPARVESGVTLGGEGVRVERDKGILGADFLERIVQSQEAREVIRVGDEGGPDWEKEKW